MKSYGITELWCHLQWHTLSHHLANYTNVFLSNVKLLMWGQIQNFWSYGQLYEVMWLWSSWLIQVKKDNITYVLPDNNKAKIIVVLTYHKSLLICIQETFYHNIQDNIITKEMTSYVHRINSIQISTKECYKTLNEIFYFNKNSKL